MFVEEKALGEQTPRRYRASDKFLQAVNVLETYGWRQGAMGTDNQGYCLLGAIDKSAGHALTYAELVREFIRRSGILEPHHWNDKPSRTKAEVIAVLRAVAFSS